MIITTLALHLAGEEDSLDFTVFDGARTLEEQREYVRRGVSWTMDSKHLPQEDGYAHAVDLVPIINGRLRWDSIEAFQIVSKHMRTAAALHRVPLVWGALAEYGGDWTHVNDMAHFEAE
jgi:peptidoglycan L-alanyl-D-glutamate endopeptidase CwlK